MVFDAVNANYFFVIVDNSSKTFIIDRMTWWIVKTDLLVLSIFEREHDGVDRSYDFFDRLGLVKVNHPSVLMIGTCFFKHW